MITITVNKAVCRIDAPEEIINKVDALLSYKDPDFNWKPEEKLRGWDGMHRLLSAKLHKFRLGLLYRVLYFLDAEGLQYELIDKRDYTPNFQFQHIDPNRVLYVDENGTEIKPRDVQIDSVKRYCKAYYDTFLSRGIIKQPPRCGKTITACMLAQVLNEYPVVFIVHKIDLALQTKEKFEKIFNEKIGLVGDGNYDVEDCKVVVATIQSICSAFNIIEEFEELERDTGHYEEIKDFINKVKVVLMDECHVTGSNTYQTLPYKTKNAIFVAGFSGTPSRDKGDDLLVEQLCGAIIYNLPSSVAVEKGYILPCIVYVIDLPPVSALGTYQSQEKHAINNNKYIIKACEKIVKRLEKNKMSSVINIKKVEQGKNLQPVLGCEFLHGKVSSKKRAGVYDKLAKKELLTIISTVTDIGIDIPTLDAVILARVTLSSVSSLQWIRSNTPAEGKKFGYVFLLCPTVKGVKKDHVRKHGNSMKMLYKSEPTFKVIKKRFEEL